jgi:hypothetical protein
VTALDRALGVVRLAPVPALIAAAGVGWFLYRMSRKGRRGAAIRARALEEESVPILVTGHDRIYDPDISPRHPMHDLVETRREMSARA